MDLKNSDHEASMARAELVQIAKNAISLMKMIKDGDELDGWVSSHITVANDHLNSVQEHMEYKMAEKSATNSRPEEFEESVQRTVKTGLVEQWLQKKYQGRY